MLTEEQKVTATELGLTFTEMSVAFRTGIAPETYAKHKRDMQADRDAWDAKMEEFAAAVTDRLTSSVQWPREKAQSPEEVGFDR